MIASQRVVRTSVASSTHNRLQTWRLHLAASLPPETAASETNAVTFMRLLRRLPKQPGGLRRPSKPAARRVIRARCRSSLSISGQNDIVGDPEKAQSSAKSVALCRFWQRGKCNRGTACRFSHGDVSKADVESTLLSLPAPAVKRAPETPKEPILLSHIPRELIQQIGDLLASKDLVALARTSKVLWNHLRSLFENRCWQDWKSAAVTLRAALLPFASDRNVSSNKIHKNKVSANDIGEYNKSCLFERLELRRISAEGIEFAAKTDPMPEDDSEEDSEDDDYYDEDEDDDYYEDEYDDPFDYLFGEDDWTRYGPIDLQMVHYMDLFGLNQMDSDSLPFYKRVAKDAKRGYLNDLRRAEDLITVSTTNRPNLLLYLYLDPGKSGNLTASNWLKQAAETLPDEIFRLRPEMGYEKVG